MRHGTKRIQAKELKPGMTRAFDNPRFDYVIDDVSESKYGEVKIEHGDFTATTYQAKTDFVYVLAE